MRARLRSAAADGILALGVGMLAVPIVLFASDLLMRAVGQ